VSDLKIRSPKAKPENRSPKPEGRTSTGVRNSAFRTPRSAFGVPSGFGFWTSDFISRVVERGHSLLNGFDALENPRPQAVWQRRIIQRGRHSFALGQRPLQKFHQLLAFPRVPLLLINQQPRRARNRIRSFARRINHRETEIVRNF